MFKKTLTAVAVLGAFAATAYAADVTVYGIVDTGLNYSSHDLDDGKGRVNTFSMKPGVNASNRFGLKGQEDLGNGLKVAFTLESQFNSDDGTLKTAGRLWEREASIALSGGFGTITAGRLGMLRGGIGTVARFGSAVSPFSTNWVTDYIQGHSFVTASAGDVVNNSIVYTTPKFGGFDLTAQYSLANNAEGTTADKDDRYMAVAARYSVGTLNTTLLVDYTNLSQATDKDSAAKLDDPLSVSFAANYDCGFAKTFGIIHYFQDSPLKKAGSIAAGAGHYDGYGLVLGTIIPAPGGRVKAQMGYLDGEDSADVKTKGDIQRFDLSVAYEYQLSKRTMAYAGAGYVKQTIDAIGTSAKKDANGETVVIGLQHKF